MSNSERGIRFVKSTVTRLIAVSTFRNVVSTETMKRCGMASSHCTSGRHRANLPVGIEGELDGIGGGHGHWNRSCVEDCVDGWVGEPRWSPLG